IAWHPARPDEARQSRGTLWPGWAVETVIAVEAVLARRAAAEPRDVDDRVAGDDVVDRGLDLVQVSERPGQSGCDLPEIAVEDFRAAGLALRPSRLICGHRHQASQY